MRMESEARTRAAELGRRSDTVPVDLHNIGKSLCAQLRRSTIEKDRDGFLVKGKNGWIVYVQDDPTHLGHTGRATVAHEFAHILLATSGLGQPASYTECRLLEDACDRIGTYFLAPSMEEGPSILTSEDVLRYFRELTKVWLLTGTNAVRRLDGISKNLVAAAGLRLDMNCSLVDWSVSSGLCRDWPQEGQSVADGPLVEIHSEIKDIDDHVATIAIPGGCLVGLGYMYQNSRPQLSLQFPSRETSDVHGSICHTTVIFSLLDPHDGGQMSFGF